MSQKSIVVVALVAVLSFLGGVALFYRPMPHPLNGAGVGQPPALQPEVSYPHLIPPRSTLSTVLRELNVNSQTIHEIVTAAKPVLDLGRLRAGTQFRLIHLTDPSSDLTGIEFLLSPIERVQIAKVNGVWAAEKFIEAVESKVVTFRGVVNSTLWE